MTKYTYEDLLAILGIGGAHPGGMAITKKVLAAENIGKTTELLEVGCGTGRTAAYLAKNYGCKVTAIERNPIMLKKAANRFYREQVNVRLIDGLAENLPFASQSFDLVLSESVTVFTNISKSFREYFRVLRPEGVLLDLEMTAEFPLLPRELEEFTLFYGINSVPTQGEWTTLLEESGFNPISVLRGETIHSVLSNTDMAREMIPEFDSSGLNPDLYGMYLRHQHLMMRYSELVGYRVYRANSKN